MTTLRIVCQAIWLRRHPIGPRLSWREAFVLAKELVGLGLR